MKLLLPALAALLIAAPAAGAAEPPRPPLVPADLSGALVPMTAANGGVLLRVADPALRRRLSGRLVGVECERPQPEPGDVGVHTMDEVRVPRGGRAFRTGVRAGTSSHCTVWLLARGGRVRQVLGVVGLDVAGRAFADALHVGRTVTLLFGALVPFPAVSDEGRSAGDVARAAGAELLRAFDAVPSGARPGVFREGDRIAVRMRRRDGRVDFAELDAGVLRTNVHEVMFARP